MIIALAGKKRAGKSTVASHLVNRFSLKEMSWAEPLKETIGKDLLGLHHDQLYGTTEDKERPDIFWGKSSRKLLQEIGTDLFRSWDPDFWIKIGLKRMATHTSEVNFVFSDCRFPNEIEQLKSFCWSVQRPFASVLIEREGMSYTDEHESENALDSWEFDYVIKASSGQFEALYSQIEEIYHAIQEGR